MIIYFADRKMNILGQASTNLPKGVVIKEDTKTEEIETGVCTFECRICYSKETRRSIEEWSEAGNYILRSSDSDQEFYTIISVEIDTENQDIYIYAEDAGMDLLNEVLKSSKDGVARNLTEYINSAAYDSGFEIGINESDDSVKIAYGLDEQTAAERVLDISKKFGYEIAYSFAIDRLEVVHKYINIYKKRGKDTGVQLRLNREVEKITIKKSVENLATSLLCTGSADASGINISLEGYSYDDGDFYTSGHYLNSRNALAKWSRYLWHKEPGQINNVGHIVRTFTYDTVSQEELCKKSVEELKKICDIEKNYEVQITHLPDNVKIGDILNIVDDAGNLYLQSRLLKLETSIVSDTRTATLGDYLIRDDGISEKVEQLATQFKDLAKNKALYTWIVYADDSFGNGITIDPDGKDWVGITENQVSKDADLSDPLIYKWSRIGGYQGEPGADGISVVSIDDQYYLSTSSESVVGGSWQDGIPEWERGKYVWKRYKVTWSDNNVTYTNAELDRALNHANEAADLAEQKAAEAEKAANTASEAATNASKSAETASTASAAAQSLANDANKNAADAKEAANTAQTAADEANKEVETINKEISTIKEDAASTSKELQGKITSITETMEASYAKKTDVSETEANLRAEWIKSAAEIRSTMENDYAKKTELTEVQSNLQTQVTQNATDIISTASAVETVKIDASNAQKKAEEAGEAATAAQSVADRATQAAQTAQNVADRATQAAQTAADEAGKAQTAADSAAKAASAADAVAKAAQKDLDTAKANLTAVTNRVDATEEDIAAAQTAVSNAQAAADAAKANAATAQNAANAAQSTADIAKANASTAQNAANAAQTSATNAKTAADNAQKTADEAKTQVGNLSNTVTQMDTKIAQNAAAISLAATKKEVEDKLSGYSTTTEMNSAISVSATGILNTVSGTYTTKSEFENLSIGGRNLLLYSANPINSNYYTNNQLSTDETKWNGCTVLRGNTAWSGIRWRFNKNLIERNQIKVGDTLTYSIYAKTNNPTALSIILYQRYLSESGAWNMSGFMPITSEWKQYYVTFTVTEKMLTPATQSTLVGFELTQDCNAGSYVYWACPKVEKGNKATDWTPAPEDTEEDIKSINASLELKIDTDKLVSVLNASADIIHLKGNRFIVESDNFNLTADGTMTAKNGTFTGNITATSGKIGDLSLSNGMLIGTGTYTDEYGEETRNYVTKFSSMGINIESSIVSSGAEKYISKITPDEISFEATPYTAGLGALGVYAEGVDGEARISGDHSQFNYSGNEGQLYTTINSGGFVIDYAGLTYGGGTTITIGDGWGITMSGRNGGDHYLRYNAYGTLETSLYTVINASLRSTVNITADGVFYEGGTALSNKYAAKSHTHSYAASGHTHWSLISGNNAVGVGGSIERFCAYTKALDSARDNALYCGYGNGRWKRVYAANATISTSDERMKENIRSFDERYEKLFDHLEPVTYLWRNDSSDTRNDHDRTHTGFIAQQVKKSMDQSGLTVNDFAAFCYDDFTKDPEWSPESTNGFTDRYSLAYEEFISLNTHMIQKTRAEMLIQAGQLGLHQTMLNDLKDQLFEAWKEIRKLKQALAV